MKLLVSSILILLAVTVAAQERPQLLHVDYFGGLNTRSGNFQMRPGEARIAHNVDFGRNVGGLTKRYGYEVVAETDFDSVTGIYSLIFSDGISRLLVIADAAADTGHSSIWVTKPNSVDTPYTRIWEFFAHNKSFSAAMLFDRAYLVNGLHRGIITDGLNTRPFPLCAPGEPFIVPLSKSGGLQGEYRYAVSGKVFYSGGTRTIWHGRVSEPIVADNSCVLFTMFFQQPADSGVTPDSVHYYIHRTKANPGRLDYADTFYNLYAVSSPAIVWRPGIDTVSKLQFIDSIPDSSLGTGYVLDNMCIPLGRHSDSTINVRYGACSVDSVSDTLGGPEYDNYGVFRGWSSYQKDTVAIIYFCTFLDTLFGLESDSGSSTWVYRGQDPIKRIFLKLPRPWDSDSGLMVNLYRAPAIRILETDTAWFVLTVQTADSVKIVHGDPRQPPGGRMYCYWRDKRYPCEYPRRLIHGITTIKDTVIVGTPRLIHQFGYNDSVFVDSLPQDSLEDSHIYAPFIKGGAPGLLRAIIAYQGKLFGLHRSGVFVSAPILGDSLQRFDQMALTALNPDDGDAVSTIWPSRGVMRVMKSRQAFNLFQDDNLDWRRAEISGTFGCIAPQSYAKGTEGHYYLSEAGVVCESEGRFLERSYDIRLLSSKLDNFDKLSSSDLFGANAFYFDKKYMICIGDTTYVYDERASREFNSPIWSTWSLTFSSATLYSTESKVSFMPPDTMYFTKSGSNKIYKYGGVETDQGNTIPMIWKSGPLLIGPEYKSITNVGLWRQGGDIADTILVALFNESDQSIQTYHFDSLHQVYSVIGAAPNNILFGSIYIGNGTAFPWQWDIDDIAIDGFDIWYTKAGDVIIK